jgi:iron(III) transport system ATP-binding protein
MSEMPTATVRSASGDPASDALLASSLPSVQPVQRPVPDVIEPVRPPVVSVTQLRKSFFSPDGTAVPAVDNISLSLEEGKFMVLLGPSGCGKTTLLRCIAGLERPQSGRIEVSGRTVFSSEEAIDVPSYRRQLSMVFQSYALWPHMSVFDNIAYPLRSNVRSRPSKAEIKARVEKLMEIVGIPQLGKRYPSQISGGQQQRVALCRALIADSGVVLFDEPLSNIDAKVRERLRLQLLVLQRELGFAALFVTHDRQEAMVLAHSIAVLEAGKVAQLGPPRDVYDSPGSKYVAEFMGPTNLLEGRLQPGSGPVRVLETEAGLVRGTVTGPAGEAVAGDTLLAMWRPECTHISAVSSPSDNEWSVTAEQSLFSGAYMEHLFRVGELSLRTLTTEMATIAGGQRMFLSAKASDVTIVSR